MKRKIKIWCLLFLMLLFSETKEDRVNIQAANVESTQCVIQNEIKQKGGSIYGKFIEVNSSAKAEKLVVSVPEFTKGNYVRVILCDNNKNQISEPTKITSSSQKVTYFVKSGSKYYIEAHVNNANIRINVKKTALVTSAGKSFNAATTIKAGDTKGDVIGFNNGTGMKQYFKIKVDKEKLVKLSLRKTESSGSLDSMKIAIYYKSINEKNRIETGTLYEGQKSAYMLIRNSKNKQTKPGIYYIVISKSFAKSGFQYSITY